MRTAAAKGKSSWRLIAAGLTLLAATGAAEASRFTPSAANDLLEKHDASTLLGASPANDTATTITSDPSSRFPLLTAADRQALTAPLAGDLATALEGMGAEKLASGGQTWELRPNLWRLHELTTISHPSCFGYARARWYDARNASWLSEDPMQDIDSPNLYSFVAWQPHMATDPMGLLSRKERKRLAELEQLVGPRIEQLRLQRKSGGQPAPEELDQTIALLAEQAGLAAMRSSEPMASPVLSLPMTLADAIDEQVDDAKRVFSLPQRLVRGEEGAYFEFGLLAATVYLNTPQGRAIADKVGRSLGAVWQRLRNFVSEEEAVVVSPNQTGSYTITFASSKQYHGKGTVARAGESAEEKLVTYADEPVSVDWEPAVSQREAFKAEARRIRTGGGVENPNNYNKINSPGEKLLREEEKSP